MIFELFFALFRCGVTEGEVLVAVLDEGDQVFGVQ